MATRARFCFLSALPGGGKTAKDWANLPSLADTLLQLLYSSNMAVVMHLFPAVGLAEALAYFACLRGMEEMMMA